MKRRRSHSARGIVGTYHQTKPISTTANIVQQLLAKVSIDEDVVMQWIASNESERKTAKEELDKLTDHCKESPAGSNTLAQVYRRNRKRSASAWFGRSKL